MSTFQPPGGQPPGQPAYVPPQDPWAGGFEQGVASVPTDPIPQQYEPYAQGGDAWAAQTVPHGGQYMPAPQRSRAGVIAVIVLSVLVLGGGGGYATYYFVKKHGEPTTQASNSPTGAPAPLDLQTVAEGQCVINVGTGDEPVLQRSDCAAPNSYTVLRVARGTNIPKNADGKMDANTTSVAVCAGLKFQKYFAHSDKDDHNKDVFFCLQVNSTATPKAS